MFDDEYEEGYSLECLLEMKAAISYMLDNGILNRGQLESIIKHARQQSNKNLDFSDNTYLNYDEGVKAYSSVLDMGVTAEEALAIVAAYYNKDAEWIAEVKNSRYSHAKEVYLAHKNHPVQKAMEKNRVLNGKHLKNSKTPNSQLRELHRQYSLYKEMAKLKEDSKEAKEQIDILKVEASVASGSISTIYDILGMEDTSKKEKAIRFKDLGLPVNKIAKLLDIDVRTVHRYTKDLEK